MSIKIHSQNDFSGMRKAGKLAGQILDYITDFVKPGVSTGELNDICELKTQEAGAISAPLGYNGFPKSICTSINNEICHGIPDYSKILKNGDIINIDITVIVDGWHGDTSRTFFVGIPNPKVKKLVEVTYESMMIGIEKVKPGNTFGDIGYAIQNYVEKQGFSVVRDFCGHGLGRVFHDEPNVLHYGKRGSGEEIKEGMFFTIEPMVNIGKYESKIITKKPVLEKNASPVEVKGWVGVTKDQSYSAQFEHSIGVNETGYEIFTLSSNNYKGPIL